MQILIRVAKPIAWRYPRMASMLLLQMATAVLISSTYPTQMRRHQLGLLTLMMPRVWRYPRMGSMPLLQITGAVLRSSASDLSAQFFLAAPLMVGILCRPTVPRRLPVWLVGLTRSQT